MDYEATIKPGDELWTLHQNEPFHAIVSEVFTPDQANEKHRPFNTNCRVVNTAGSVQRIFPVSQTSKNRLLSAFLYQPGSLGQERINEVWFYMQELVESGPGLILNACPRPAGPNRGWAPLKLKGAFGLGACPRGACIRPLPLIRAKSIFPSWVWFKSWSSRALD